MKRISKSKQKGLSKLPEDVVNKMGFTKENMKAKYGTGKMLTEMKYGDMSEPMQVRMQGGEGNVPKTSAEYDKIEQARFGKLPKAQFMTKLLDAAEYIPFLGGPLRGARKLGKKARYGQSMQTPGK